MSVQQTLVLVKPDAMKRHLMGPAVDPNWKKPKLQLVAAKLVLVSEKLANDQLLPIMSGKTVFFRNWLNTSPGKLHGNTPAVGAGLSWRRIPSKDPQLVGQHHIRKKAENRHGAWKFSSNHHSGRFC